MDRMRCHYRHFSLPLEKEHRLAREEGLPNEKSIVDRFKETDDLMKLEAKSGDARKKLGEISGRLNPKRLDAKDIDEENTRDLLHASERLFLAGVVPDSPRARGAMEKALMIREAFSSVESVDGIRFGIEGRQFKVLDAHETFIEWALEYIVANQDELMNPAGPEVIVTRQKGESVESFNKAKLAAENQARQMGQYTKETGAEQVAQWMMVTNALRSYKCQFEELKWMLKQVERDPKAINSIPDKLKRENPVPYMNALVVAAQKDTSVLRGKEKELKSEDFVRIVKKAAGISEEKVVSPSDKGNPLALQYLPDDIKRTVDYRNWMTEGAKRDGSVLLVAASEYEKFFKETPEYRDLCVNAVTQKPELFFLHSRWLKPDSAQALMNIEERLDTETKIGIVKLMHPSNLSVFERLKGGYAGFLERMLDAVTPTSVAADPAVLKAIAGNTVLFDFIKKGDEKLYKKLRTELAATDADVRKVRKESEGVMEDEDLIAEVIKRLNVSLKSGDFNAVRDGRVDLKGIPEHVWRTDANKELFIKLFSTQGDLFAHAPLWMRSKKEYALPIIINNASAYANAIEDVRADPEVLYAALLAEKKRGKGEMHWKHVPLELQVRLQEAGFDGIVTDYDNMLRVLILGLKEKKAPLTPEQVHSLIDSWTPEMRNNKELVTAYFERALLGHPEFYLDASEELRNDIKFAKKMVAMNAQVFAFITEKQHSTFDGASQKDYRSMVSSAVARDPELFEKIPESLRSKAEFITDIIRSSGRVELLKFAPDSVRQDVEFLVSILQGLFDRGAGSIAAVREFFKIIPEGTLEEILLKDNGVLLLKFFDLFPNAQDLVPRSALRGDLLHKILQKLKDKDARNHAYNVLARATPAARQEYFTDHPEVLLFLFKKDSRGLITLVAGPFITVDLLTQLTEEYGDTEIRDLFTGLRTVKPQVLVGLLRRRPSLWDRMGTEQQQEIMRSLDASTLALLSEGAENREKERASQERSRLLDDLRGLRQEARYLLGLTPMKSGMPNLKWDKKTYSADFLRNWLEKDHVGPLLKNVEQGKATREEIRKVTDIYRYLVKELRSAVDASAVQKDKIADAFDVQILPVGIDQGQMTDGSVARLLTLRELIRVQEGKPLKGLTPLQQKSRKEFLEAAQKQYDDSLTAIVDKACVFAIRGQTPETLSRFLRNADKLLPLTRAAIDQNTQALKREQWNRKDEEIRSRIKDARKALDAAQNPTLNLDEEDLYNLEKSSLELIETISRELGVDKVKLAKTLMEQGTQNTLVMSERWLPLLQKPQQWEKVANVASAAKIDLKNALENGDLRAFSNCLLLSQEKHAAAIITAAIKDPEFAALPGEARDFDPQIDRSMVMMVSRELGSSFDGARTKNLWNAARMLQMERFGSSADLKIEAGGKKAKAIDVFVIVEDDGPEGAGKKILARTPILTSTLNLQNSTLGKTESRVIRDLQGFKEALADFKKMESNTQYGPDGNRHLVLRVFSHGKKTSGNALDINPGKVASGLDPARSTLLYTSCSGGNHLTEMFGDDLKDSGINVFSEVAGTTLPLHTDDLLEKQLVGAYTKGSDGKYEADYNGDGVVTLPEAYHWFDRQSSFQDPAAFGPGGKQFTSTKEGKKAEGLA